MSLICNKYTSAIDQNWIIIVTYYLNFYTVVTVFIAHFSRVIHSAEIDRLTAL